MGHKYDGELRQRAEDFIMALAQAGITGAIMPDSFRAYSVKVAISRGNRSFGPVIIYYSPKKGAFTMRAHELRDASIRPELDACWSRPPTSTSNSADLAVEQSQTGTQIYVDGSCLGDDVGYGLVVLQNDHIVYEASGPLEDEAVQGMRQVAGELRAVKEAITWCQGHGIAEVSLFYDYEGIQKWATGEWRAKKPATQAYARAARTWSVTVHWHKVDSHRGNRWNDYADRLAKRGAEQAQRSKQEKLDPLSEALGMADQFARFLVQRGIDASCQGLINRQFARIVIGSKDGYVDVYNTRRRSVFAPRMHSFPDALFKERIDRLWQEFLSGDRGTEHSKNTILKHVSHYYEILRPYRDCEFDFIDLARAINSAFELLTHRNIDVEATRYDFEALEELYSKLREEAR